MNTPPIRLERADVMGSEWTERSTCKTQHIPTEVFYFEDQFGPGQQSSRAFQEAKRYATDICMSCPVRMECFLYGLVAREEGGMFGAVPFSERKSMKRVRDEVERALQHGSVFQFTSRRTVAINTEVRAA